jgi:hypothetical protein
VEQSQVLFNIAVSLVGALGGWWMNIMWQALRDLQKADKILAEKVSSIEILVAGNYVKRDDFDKVADNIFRKLDRIEDKLDNKMDK